MAVTKGTVSVQAQNIMPVIKRWLYSDKDIFLREAVSNGCDAITKYRMLHIGTDEDMRVTVTVDKEKKELRISDTGIGMTADEVEKYINQVAFSGAEEFLKNYQEKKPAGDGDKAEDRSGIIGHFGLGFYSVFMVSDSVEIETLSCAEGAEPVHWESSDGMAFEMSAGTRTAHGTTVTLHISEDEKEFLEVYRARQVLERYCGYMNSPVYLEDADAKPVERDVPVEGETNEDGTPKTKKVTEEPQPRLINDVHPLWLNKPSDCTEEQYRTFYHRMFTDIDDPLFWIHLNVDYPFNLKGILYFPKLKQDFGPHDGQIKLFSGQVFVADNIKEVIPEFLMLLKGVIDCPDLPLNVSRSYLQNDGYVQKIRTYISKKVADRLTGIFNSDRKAYEGYWNDIAPFVKYGCMQDAKFGEAMKDAIIWHTTGDEWLTLKEYRDRNTEKLEKKVVYTNDPKRQAAAIALYEQRGIDVAVMDTVIDNSYMNFMEYSGGEDAPSFARVDADVSGLTEDSQEGTELDAEKLQALFRESLGRSGLKVELKAFADAGLAAMVTEEEQGRRFKELTRVYGQQGFRMPEQFTLVLNRRSPAVQAIAARDPQDANTKLLCQQVFDLARMSAQPLEAEEITAFLSRSQQLLAMLAANAPEAPKAGPSDEAPASDAN